MKGNIDKIILSILNGTATKSEENFFSAWIHEDEVNQVTFNHIKSYWRVNENESEIINEDDVKDKIWEKAHESRQVRSRKFSPLKYLAAAVVVLIFSFSFLIKILLFPPAIDVKAVKLNIIEKKNLVGVKSKIHLPDGSLVHLNSESSIKFIEGFNDSIRWIELDGEAFFDVAKNPDKAFVVKSGDIIIKVLGTAFNIKAYADNPTIDVSLVEGRVEVRSVHYQHSDKSTYLEPGQSVSFDDNSALKYDSFNFEDVLGWKDGLIHFENADYQAVTKKLQRWYGIKIELEGSEPKWNLDANFKNKSLEHIMEVISHSEQIEYQLFGDTLKIKAK
jgi:ferric-dicitrate binding protein FerR (iron transport regulator)